MKIYSLLLASLALLAGCGAPSLDVGSEEGESSSRGSASDTVEGEDVGSVKAQLNNGTYTTSLFPEVMQILISKGGSQYVCTATAISEDVLLTAAHCIKDGDTMADWVKVYNADGDNNGTEGQYSSYFVVSKYMYSSWYNDGTVDSVAKYRDIAFIKFGKKTFSKYLSFSYKTDLATSGSTVTMVGFGDKTTKAYGTRTIRSATSTTSTSGYGYFTVDSDTNSQAYTEGGDSGGPLLVQQNGQYYVVAVLSGAGMYSNSSTQAQIYPALTKGLFDHASTFITAKDKYCIEAYKNSLSSSWAGSWAFCIEGSINSALEAQGFYDPFNVYAHGKDSTWNDQISAFTIPSTMSGTFYQHSSFGGSSVTFVNAFSFLDNSTVDNLKSFSFNDMISSWSITYAGSPTIYLKSEKSGKCIDVPSGSTSTGTNMQQWSCANGNTNQQFQLVSTSTENVYLIKSLKSGLCLDVKNGSSSNGTRIQQWTCDSSNQNQLFRFEQFPSQNKFHMVNVGNGKCIDQDGSTSDGGIVKIWECLSSSNASVNNQVFSFTMY